MEIDCEYFRPGAEILLTNASDDDATIDRRDRLTEWVLKLTCDGSSSSNDGIDSDSDINGSSSSANSANSDVGASTPSSPSPSQFPADRQLRCTLNFVCLRALAMLMPAVIVALSLVCSLSLHSCSVLSLALFDTCGSVKAN